VTLLDVTRADDRHTFERLSAEPGRAAITRGEPGAGFGRRRTGHRAGMLLPWTPEGSGRLSRRHGHQPDGTGPFQRL